jgi:hypothetical protein
MGTAFNARIGFDSHELEWVGGDYGEIALKGTTEAARRALDTISGRVRGCGCIPRIRLVVDIDDTPSPVVEDRHAGREGTPESGVATGERDASGAESVVETGAADGSAADPE